MIKAAKLGIREEEMGLLCEARMNDLDLALVLTPIIGKLRIHVQSYIVT